MFRPILLSVLLAACLTPATRIHAVDANAIVDELAKAMLLPDANHLAGESPAPLPAATGYAGTHHGLYPDVRVRVTAERHTILSTKSTGRIEKITVRDGDRFEKGQLLVQQDPSLQEAQLERAKVAFQRQELLYEMIRELGELQTKGEIEVQVARMEMELARTEMTATKLFLDRTRVTAPFSGRVADVFVREEQFMGEGQPLLEILDDSTLALEFIASSTWISWFTPGFNFQVVIEETGREYDAVLDRIGGKVDPLSQSMKAYARLVDPGDDLMEGMSGAARIVPPPGAAR